MDSTTKMAISATLHCLLGCSIGEVGGMVIGTAFNLHNLVVTILSTALAFVFGYGLTMRAVLRHGVSFRRALSVAIGSDTLSITSMEIMDNLFIWIVPGAVNAMLNNILFWWSLLASLVVAFIVTVPVNRWLIARGKGHALMHEFHGHHDHHH